MFRALMWILAVVLIAALGVGAWMFRNIAASGQFTTLKPVSTSTCQAVSGLTGVEDLVIDRDSGFVFFSATDRRALMAGQAPASAGIYLGLYDQPGLTPQNLTASLGDTFRPHGISLYRAADGAKTLAVVNHPQADASEIMLFDVIEDRPNGGAPVVSLKLRQTITDTAMPSANDVHLVSPTQFYASVDRGSRTRLGETLETWLNLRRSSVAYWNGEAMSRVAGGLIYANGVNGNRDNSMIYVAETTGLTLRFYARDAQTGALTEKDHLYLGTALDNIDVDAEGTIWIAAHPHVLDFAGHAGDAKKLSPSQVLRITAPSATAGEARQVYLDTGAEISGSSVAAVHNGRMLVGSVFEPKFLNCTQPK
jgi:arylesterase / paraoxonase